MDLVAFGGSAAGAIVALLEYQNGQISVGHLIVIILLSAEFFIPMRLLGSYFHIAMNGIAASDRIFKVLDTPESEEKTSGSIKLSMPLSLSHVDFSYNADRPILNDVSLTIAPGKLTAIVGESILDNIRLGNQDATREEIILVAKKASIHDFIMSLPQGYDSKVGELGSFVSSGEKQRIGLARAFLRQSDLLILDEPTSNLDTLNEAEILKAIKENVNEQTIVLILNSIVIIIINPLVIRLKNICKI